MAGSGDNTECWLGDDGEDIRVPKSLNGRTITALRTIDSSVFDHAIRKVQSLKDVRGAPSSNYHRNQWWILYEQYVSRRGLDLTIPPTGSDIEVFLRVVIECMKPTIIDKKILSVTSFKRGLKGLISHLKFRYSSFGLSEHEKIRISATLDSLQKEGKLLGERWRKPQWIGFQQLNALITAYVWHGLVFGTKSWDVRISRCASLVFQASLAARAGEVAQSHLYAGREFLAWQDIELQLVGGNLFEHLVACVTIKWEKNRKTETSENREVFWKPLTDERYAVVDPIRYVLVLALRTGQCASTTIEGLLSEIARDSDKTARWLYPNRPMVPLTHNFRLDLEKPASIAQLRTSLNQAADIGGLKIRPRTHDLRYGAAREINLLDATAAGPSLATAAAIGHTPATYNQGTTALYTGRQSMFLWNRRAELADTPQLSNFGPKFATKPFEYKRKTFIEREEARDSLEQSKDWYRKWYRERAAWSEEHSLPGEGSDRRAIVQDRTSNQTHLIHSMYMTYESPGGSSVTRSLQGVDTSGLSDNMGDWVKKTPFSNVHELKDCIRAAECDTVMEGSTEDAESLHTDDGLLFLDDRNSHHNATHRKSKSYPNTMDEDDNYDGTDKGHDLRRLEEGEDCDSIDEEYDPWRLEEGDDCSGMDEEYDLWYLDEDDDPDATNEEDDDEVEDISPFGKSSLLGQPLAMDSISFVRYFASIHLVLLQHRRIKSEAEWRSLGVPIGNSREFPRQFEFFCGNLECTFSCLSRRIRDRHQKCDCLWRPGASSRDIYVRTTGRKPGRKSVQGQKHPTSQSTPHTSTDVVHSGISTGWIPRTCLRCTSAELYYSKRTYDAHIRAVHEREECSCDLCGKEFASRAYLRVHLRGTHELTRERVTELVPHRLKLKHPDALPWVPIQCPLGNCSMQFDKIKQRESFLHHLQRKPHNLSEEVARSIAGCVPLDNQNDEQGDTETYEDAGNLRAGTEDGSLTVPIEGIDHESHREHKQADDLLVEDSYKSEQPGKTLSCPIGGCRHAWKPFFKGSMLLKHLEGPHRMGTAQATDLVQSQCQLAGMRFMSGSRERVRCPEAVCNQKKVPTQFSEKATLKRHLISMHRYTLADADKVSQEITSELSEFLCPEDGCSSSRQGFGFPRKQKAQQHLMVKHKYSAEAAKLAMMHE